MKKAGYLGLVATMAASGWHLTEPSRYFKAKPKPVKQCLECGKEHKHNNSWCSAECCKAYRQKK